MVLLIGFHYNNAKKRKILHEKEKKMRKIMEMKEKFPFSCKIFYFSCFMNEVDKKSSTFAL